MATSSFSRRSFVAGTAAIAAAGSAAIAVSASSIASADEAAKTVVGAPSAFTPLLLVPPNPISEANIARTYECEAQIAALLLESRSRPYIRDELVISLNTVHTHARSIYSKCGVHSQREFMELPDAK